MHPVWIVILFPIEIVYCVLAGACNGAARAVGNARREWREWRDGWHTRGRARP